MFLVGCVEHARVKLTSDVRHHVVRLISHDNCESQVRALHLFAEQPDEDDDDDDDR